MPSESWDLRLSDVGRIVTGKTPPTSHPDYFGGDIPFVTPTDMDGRRTIAETERYLTDAGARSVAGSRIPAGAVMVSCIGSDMGKAAIAGRDSVTNQQINTIVVSPRYVPLFVYYNLSVRKTELRNMAVGGSAVPILNKGHFAELPIEVPPRDVQISIARILGALDDKIELNRKMNETLEQTARAIFKSWFVDFEPFRDKGMVDSPLGKIPKGWSSQALYDCADFVNGAAYSDIDFSGDRSGLPVVKISELKDGITAQTKFTNGNLGARYRINSGDMLYSWSGSPDTSLDVFVWMGGPAWLNQHIFRVDLPHSRSRCFVYLLLRTLKSRLIEIARDKQTTGLGHVTARDMKELLVVMPPHQVLAGFEERVGALYDRRLANDTESRTLAAIRDALLPKLMSGEIRTTSDEVRSANCEKQDGRDTNDERRTTRCEVRTIGSTKAEVRSTSEDGRR